MTRIHLCLTALFAFLLAAMVAAPASAQATRTWVSGVGDDVNPCSRTAPCKTFAGAISKTAAGGEINCLDPGGFGSVTITKALAIICVGVEGGISAPGTNGIIVNAGAADVVYLSGLDIQGFNTGIDGVRFLGGKALYLQDMTIRGFATNGVNFAPTAANTALTITNSRILDNPYAATGGGILIKPAAGLTTVATLSNVLSSRNAFGIRIEDGAKVSLDRSTISSNTNNGALAFSASSASELMISNTQIANNANNGISTSGANSTIRIKDVTIFGSATGINTSGGGIVSSFSPASTANAGNGTPGAPNGAAVPLQ